MRTVAALVSRRTALGLLLVPALCMLVLTLTGCGSSATAETARVSASQPSTAQTGNEANTDPSPSSDSVNAPVAELFDSSTVHEIAVSFDQAEYQAMIETYSTSGVKDWIDATVTIDGETYQDVGMRLKGNSSIRGLREGRSGGGPSANSSADRPEGLPWLIRLDENIETQNHQGIVELVVRSNTWETSLNEAVSLELLEMAGLASQKAIAVSFSVNGSEAVLRLVTEHPDELWMQENLGAAGALYKAESTGDYSYRGDDPDMYDQVFDQEAGKDNADLTPLIDFLDFINNADDATFNAELAERLDVESFATYLAAEELIGNFDDIDGPGNNSYLYYDPETGMFTVVPWDHNLAFGGFGGRGNVPEAVVAALPGEGASPGGGAPPGQGNEPRVGGRGKSNVLVNRFLADPGFETLYQQKLAELSVQLYQSGAAADILDRWVSVLETQASDLVASSTVQQEAERISKYFTTE